MKKKKEGGPQENRIPYEKNIGLSPPSAHPTIPVLVQVEESSINSKLQQQQQLYDDGQNEFSCLRRSKCIYWLDVCGAGTHTHTRHFRLLQFAGSKKRSALPVFVSSPSIVFSVALWWWWLLTTVPLFVKHCGRTEKKNTVHAISMPELYRPVLHREFVLLWIASIPGESS